jgi:hypothetical protein
MRKITRFQKIYLFVVALVIAAQLTYVPHQLYQIRYSDEGVPYYSNSIVKYDYLVTYHLFTVDLKTRRMTESSKIAVDILAMQLAVTLLISGSFYVLVKPRAKEG